MPTYDKADLQRRMHGAVEVLKNDLGGLRTGRASTALLDRISVDYYGTKTPLNQLASITVPDARLLLVTPYDKSAMREIERALMESDLGITPGNDGKVIRLPIPALTEERRKDMVKIAHRIAEEGRVAVRNVRRDANNHLKDLLKQKKVAEDEERRAQDDVQKLTDRHIAEIDKALAAKEADLKAV